MNDRLRSLVETAVDLDLSRVFLLTVVRISTLEDSIAGAFFRAILLLGTHRLIVCLDGTMRATSVALRHDCDLLDAVLAATGTGWNSTSRAVASFVYGWGAEADFGSSSHDRAGCRESYSCGLVASWVDELLPNDCSLISSSHVGLLRADSAARV